MWAGLAARVHPEGNGYRVTVAGLPAGAVVNEATVRVGDQWYSLTEKIPVQEPDPAKPVMPVVPQQLKPVRAGPIVPIGEHRDGSWSALFDWYVSSSPGKTWSNPPEAENARFYFPWGAGGALDARPGPLLDLPGADRRGLAVDRYVATGRYGAVYLNVTGCPSDVKLDWPADSSHTAVLRLVVPLESEAK